MVSAPAVANEPPYTGRAIRRRQDADLLRETISFTGMAEGNAMTTPVCMANAVADALGVAEISLPLTPERMLGLLRQRHRTGPPTETFDR